MLSNIDEFLDQLRQDKLHIDERSKERSEQYKRATDLYLKSIKNEINTLDQTQNSHALRNREFRNQIKDVYSRYLANSYRIIKAQKKTVSDKIHLNDFLVLAYPDYADKQKSQLEKKTAQLARRLETLKDLNRKENVNYYEIMNQKYESFEYLDQIKARREQLEKEVMETKKMLRKNNTVTEGDIGRGFMKEFKDMYGTEYNEKKPPLPQPVQERIPQHKYSDRELLDEFIIPNGREYENKNFFSTYQPEIKEVKNLQQYITINNAPRQTHQDLPKQSMLDKFIMKGGGSQQNLNGSFRVIPSVRGEDPKKSLSAQRNRHSQSYGAFGNSGQINFEDSRENSPEQIYQQPHTNSTPNRIPKSNYSQIPPRNVENINFPYSKKTHDIVPDHRNFSNKKKFE